MHHWDHATFIHESLLLWKLYRYKKDVAITCDIQERWVFVLCFRVYLRCMDTDLNRRCGTVWWRFDTNRTVDLGKLWSLGPWHCFFLFVWHRSIFHISSAWLNPIFVSCDSSTCFCCFTQLTCLCMFDLWQFAPCVSAPKVMASEHATNSRTDKNLCGWQGELWVLFPWCSILTLLIYKHKKHHVFCRQDDGFKWIEIEISTMSVLLHRLVRLCF